MKRIMLLCLPLVFMLFAFGCSKRDKVIFLDRSNPKLAVINESLDDYMFIREDFNEPDRVWSYLEELVALYYKSYQQVGSSGSLKRMERSDLSAWLRGKEKSESVLRQLCSDPKFVLEANKWKIAFNVFKRDGSVVRWGVEGEYYPENQYNQIDKIEISTLKPKGTFSWPFA